MAVIRGREYTFPPTGDDWDQIDLSNHSTISPAVWRINLTFIVLVGFVVSLRVSTRALMVRQLFLDDILIVFAALFQMVVSAVGLAATRFGLGQHIWNLPLPVEHMLEMIKHCVQLMFVANVFYACAIATTKLSIIASYLRIFPNSGLRKFMYITGAFIIGLWISAIFATIFQCRPVNAAWDFTIEGKCYSFANFLYASAGVNIATDLIVCLAPIPYFWKLNLPVRQKVIVSFLFLVGLFACVASMIRLSYLPMLKGLDVTYALVPSLNWSVIECSLGIICVSVPPLRPLFAKLVPNFLKSQTSRHSRTTNINRGLGATALTQDQRSKEMSGHIMDYESLGSDNGKSHMRSPEEISITGSGSIIELSPVRPDTSGV